MDDGRGECGHLCLALPVVAREVVTSDLAQEMKENREEEGYLDCVGYKGKEPGKYGRVGASHRGTQPGGTGEVSGETTGHVNSLMCKVVCTVYTVHQVMCQVLYHLWWSR